MSSGPTPATPVPRAAHAGDETAPWGNQSPHHQTGNARQSARRPAHRPTPQKPPAGPDQRYRLDKPRAISDVVPEHVGSSGSPWRLEVSEATSPKEDTG